MTKEIEFCACFSSIGNPIQFTNHGAGLIKLEIDETELAETAKLLLLLKGKTFKVRIPLEDVKDKSQRRVNEPKQKRDIRRRSVDT